MCMAVKVKAQSIKKRTDESDVPKLKTCYLKDTVREFKDKPTHASAPPLLVFSIYTGP